MAEGTLGSPLEIKQIAEQALSIQKHLLRRAWGVLYATYAVSMFVAVFGEPLIGATGLAAEFTIAERVAVAMTASGAALAVTLWAFRRVRDTVEIRSIVTEGKWSRVLRYSVLVPIWVAIYAVLILGLSFFGSYETLLILMVYTAFWGFLCYALRLSFPDTLPIEGIVAISSFGIAIAGSALTTLSLSVAPLSGLLWGVSVVVWVLSAVYARTRRLPGSGEVTAA